MDVSDSMIGRQLGNCIITEKLGEGGMAVVYKAHQPSLNRDVAVKILTGPMARDEEFVNRFRREAVAAGALGHPHILTIYDAGVTDDGLHYIVMELATGGTLKDLLASGPLPPERARNIAAQLAGALQAAHEHGIVHRDLKPSNILFARDGRPLLMDFGVALTSSGTRFTRTGMAVGTPEYMSPEQAQGLSVDGRSDIYSLGILLYEMLTGELPFVGETPLGTLYQQVHNIVSPAALTAAGVPGWLSAIVQRALAKNPDERFPDAAAMAAALRGEAPPAAAVAPEPAPPTRRVRAAPVTPSPQPAAAITPAPLPAAARRGRAGLWTGLLLAAAVLVAGLTYVLFFRDLWSARSGGGQVAVASGTPVLSHDAEQTVAAMVQQTATAAAWSTAQAGGAATATAVGTSESDAGATRAVVAATSLAQVHQTLTVEAARSTAGADETAAAWSGAEQRRTAEARAAGTATAAAAATRGALLDEIHRENTATAAAQATAEADAVARAFATTQAVATATAQAAATATAQARAAVTPTPVPGVPLAILFTRQEMGQDDVFVERGQTRTNLSNNPARDYAAVFSADGQRVAFVSDRDGNPDIFVMNADGGNPLNLTRDPGFDSAPSWSPDGRWIAFHSARSGLYQIWTVRSDGSETRHLIQSGQQDYAPEWSPDGSRLAFYRTVEGANYEIMLAQSDGGNVQRLSYEGGWDYFPKWTSTGDRLLFKSRREGGDTDRLYLMNLDGSNVQRLSGYVYVMDQANYPWVTNYSQ